ncbi:OmpA family protein [Duganella aceris]|uniref:OmpA family protein n=1 Tax=Duganella aceris TaxID=2703883 RepID=A0ABX0FNU8_9BURK|nr:OmpA family protein [Duganella aceris]NGZ86130.1 OmpA family protein [Duganella aceris]
MKPPLSLKFLGVAVCGALIGACATDPRTGQPSLQQSFGGGDPCADTARNTGIAIGALAGAILGNQSRHSDRGRIIGALAGATIGGLIGRDMDQRRCELANIAKQYDLNLKTSLISASGEVIEAGQQQDAVGMAVEVREQAGRGGHFNTDSDQLTEHAQRYFSAIADAYNARIIASHLGDPAQKADYIAQISQRKILLIGHTDDTGDSRSNADLSERRARAVAAYMEKRGIPVDALHFQGAGEAYPIADNASEEGRAQNRRVEIVEVANAAGLNRYLAGRKPRYELYRPAGTHVPARPQNAPAAAPAPAPSKPATAARPATVAVADGIDFGGNPLSASTAIDIGQPNAHSRPLFSLISRAFANEPVVIADCTRDRPRVAHGVKTLADGKLYKTSEYLPGLYGKTWAEQVNGHLVVLNKVAVLASNGAAANPPEFKVYTGYDPAASARAAPAVSATPEVNTYLGDKGVLYRMFLNGAGGLSCVDVVFGSDGAGRAKTGRLIYTRGARLMSADFKPTIHQQ